HLFLHAREVDHRHRVIEPNQALTAVDVAEELDQLFVPAQLRVISLDLARGYIAQRLHLDGVDDRRRHLLARPEAPADRQPDHLSGFILVPLAPPAEVFSNALRIGQSATASEPSFMPSVSRYGEATDPLSR